ncbi:MAG: sugar ABC transporter permease [Rhizobiales bacterium]|nr:sugar ABC transporter permease [Hyphomicrobiales bacterium]
MLPFRSRLSVLFFLGPPLLVYVAAVVLPIGQSLYLSLFDWDGIFDPVFVGLGNYKKMFTADPSFWASLGRSLVYVAVTLVFQLGVALLIANLLTYVTRGREVLKTLVVLPAIVSTVAIALLFRRLYSFDPPGLINQLLDFVGLGALARPWLSDLATVLPAVSVPEGWRFFGIYMLILYGGLLAVPKELEEAARLDGASDWQIFRYVRFPYLRPVWITTAIVATTNALRGFDIPYLLTNGGPGEASELLTTYMYKTAFAHTQFGYASALSVAIVVECLVAVGIILAMVRKAGFNL